MNLNPLCIGQRIPQFEERDVGILRNQPFEKKSGAVPVFPAAAGVPEVRARRALSS